MEKKLLTKQKIIFKKLKSISKKQPYFSIIILHEYMRNIFPSDSHIKFKIKNPFKRILHLQSYILNFINAIEQFGFYKLKFKSKNYPMELKVKTSSVYGRQWKLFSKKENLKAKSYLKNRLADLKLKNIFKNKKVIDVGCGGGRYSNAIRLMGAKKIIGVDYGDAGIKTAKKNYNYKNLIFKKQNVLSLKFDDRSFDVVYCNGVLHHTSNLEKGLNEIYRICKPNGIIFLYLYGRGGIFWHARKQMNKLIKSIPQKYSQEVLDLIGMPTNRYLFIDNWYVPIEKHSSEHEVIKFFKNKKVQYIEKIKKGRETDLITGLKKFKNSKIIWGEGEIRLLIKK